MKAGSKLPLPLRAQWWERELLQVAVVLGPPQNPSPVAWALL
eukprot:CAMPEP_0171070518 /NCGR_PEP_ID=MMETSP0766_2-20121228/9799_1 /TAXON_ID=439317 /ORGANISM="Gambierdiscus australes, Strain CAWD 149" /LENGTH=41 /DNA_ID= /DNA_START= /DNA_END= /DNA_ORIENTATION=